MLRRVVLLFLMFSQLITTAVLASSNGAVVNGNIKISGAGNSIIFPDGTAQTTAMLQGLQGIKGDQGPQGAQGVAGPTGPQGPEPTIQWLLKYQTFVSSIPAVGTTAAYTQTNVVTNHFNTNGKTSGWTQTVQNGPSNYPIVFVSYMTSFDDHGNFVDGYQIQSNKTSSTLLSHSYLYDAQGRKIQRVRTIYNPDQSINSTKTDYYDVNNHGVASSTVTESGATKTTTTYNYTNIDSNGYPYAGTTQSTVETNGAKTSEYTGIVYYEWVQHLVP